MCLHVVGKLLSQHVAEKMAKQMEYQWVAEERSTQV
jgi:hypothetical protein